MWIRNRPMRTVISTALLVLVCAACAPAAPSRPSTGGSPGQADAAAAQRQPGRTLVTVVRLEPTSLAVRPVSESGSGVGFITRLFNATLDLVDATSRRRYLDLVAHFNAKLGEAARENGVGYVDLFATTADAGRRGRPECFVDANHVRPSAIAAAIAAAGI